jgi:pimeloyl-ACP methyl ester carboxylesterase
MANRSHYTTVSRLEILECRPSCKRSDLRLLFVHGISAGAWVCNEHFLPYFAAAGFASFAVSLRGHGESGGRQRLPFHQQGTYRLMPTALHRAGLQDARSLK